MASENLSNEEHHWKVLSSEYLTNHSFFTARKDKCVNFAGKIIEQYYVVEMNMTVCALGVTEDNQAILIKQYRHPIEKIILEVPGGFADNNEDPAKAVAREFAEETGYEFSHVEYVGQVAANPGIINSYTKLYLATGGRKTTIQKLDDNEEIEIILKPVKEVKKMLLENKFEQALHTSCVFYALMKLGELNCA
jgi:8-oxo-dGTP pyrophosphatase MutT (NUDIX family)